MKRHGNGYDLDHYVAALLNPDATADLKRRILREIRALAVEQLHRLGTLDRMGITREVLNDNDVAVAVNLELRHPQWRRRERRAAQLLRWCVDGDEHGVDHAATVRVLTAMLGMYRAASDDRQSDIATNPRKLDEYQEMAIRRAYKARVAAGDKYGAIKSLATEYGVHRDTISAIVNPKPSKRNAE